MLNGHEKQVFPPHKRTYLAISSNVWAPTILVPFASFARKSSTFETVLLKAHTCNTAPVSIKQQLNHRYMKYYKNFKHLLQILYHSYSISNSAPLLLALQQQYQRSPLAPFFFVCHQTANVSSKYSLAYVQSQQETMFSINNLYLDK